MMCALPLTSQRRSASRRYAKGRGEIWKSSSGFTLLEVLVAVAVLAFISTMVWYSFAQTFHTIDRVRADSDLLRQARQVTSRVPGEMTGAFLPTSINPGSQVKYEFVAEDRGTLDRVRFDTLMHTKLYQDVNEGDQAEIEYFTEADPKDKQYSRILRREDPVVDDRPEEGGSTLVIAERVKAFDLTYYDFQKDAWVDYWDSTKVEYSNRVPYAMRLKVTMVDSDGIDRTWVTATTIRLSRPMEQR